MGYEAGNEWVNKLFRHYDERKNSDGFRKLLDEVKRYNQVLSYNSLSDHEVYFLYSSNLMTILYKIFTNYINMLIFLIIFLPSLVCLMPIGVFNTFSSAAEAKR